MSKQKSFLKNRIFLVTIITAVIIIAAYLVIASIPKPPAPEPTTKPPTRKVEYEVLDPPGLLYNSTSDEAKMSVRFTPSDNDMYLSNMTLPAHRRTYFFDEPVYKTGTDLHFTFSNYSSLESLSPLGVVEVVCTFSDVNTKITITKITIYVLHVQEPGQF